MMDETLERLGTWLRNGVGLWLLNMRLRWKQWLAAARRTRRIRRVRRRLPVRSMKANAKRAAHRYAERVTGRDLSWRAARKLLRRLEREGKEHGFIANGVRGAVAERAD
jgi:hypothetical protein